MPVRSLHSSVIRWPARDVVIGSFREWLANARSAHPELEATGYFGSYARGGESRFASMLASEAEWIVAPG